MPVCKKCGERFPYRINIDGVAKHLANRKYCLKCSPWGKHNTRQQHICSSDMKKCPRCQTIKTLDNFYTRKYKNQIKPSHYCIPCSIEYTLHRIDKIKQKCIQYKGGSCIICGYDKCTGALDFHHKNRSEKSYDISTKIRCLSFELLKLELDKCILVCCRCHREIEMGVHDISQY